MTTINHMNLLFQTTPRSLTLREFFDDDRPSLLQLLIFGFAAHTFVFSFTLFPSNLIYFTEIT